MSNETLRLLQAHRSDRSFLDQPVSEADLAQIVEAAHRAPTSNNGQHISLVVVRDAARRAKIAQLANNQPWIAKAPVFVVVVVDFHKTRLAIEMAGKTPMVGVSLGYVDQPAAQKPRLPLETYRHDETYCGDTLAAGIAAYDQTLMAHWQLTGRADGLPWSANTAAAYERGCARKTAAVALAQGFAFNK